MTKTIVTRLRQLEGGLLRRVARFRRRPGEGMTDYMRRATRSARDVYKKQGCILIEEQILGRLFDWVGEHLSGPLDDFRKAWVQDGMNTLSEADWRVKSAIHSALESGEPWHKRVKLGALRWRHRPGWTRMATWEDFFINTLGNDWRDYLARAGGLIESTGLRAPWTAST